MRNIFLVVICFCYFQVSAQDEAMAIKTLKHLDDSIGLVHLDSIQYYRKSYENGDTAVEKDWTKWVDKYRQARTDIYKIIIRRFPNTHTAAEHFHWFYYEVPFDTLMSLYNALGPVALAHKNGQHATTFVERAKKLQPGMPAPDFMQPDTKGQPVHLKDFKGKMILLEFWAYWCKPCRAENPNIKAAYAKYQPHGFEVISISMDKETDKEKWLKAIAQDGLTWTQVSDLKGFDNEAFQLYNVTPIPDNYLIDAAGNIVARGLRGKQLNDVLQSMFGF